MNITFERTFFCDGKRGALLGYASQVNGASAFEGVTTRLTGQRLKGGCECSGSIAVVAEVAAEPRTTSSAPQPATTARQSIRLALPSKGRMAEDTLALLRECQLSIRKPNPRQYIAEIEEMEEVEVWFQRASDVVRKLKKGDVDLGIVGFDMVKEFGEDDNNLVVVHDSLGFGKCHLAIAVPSYGIFQNVNTLEDLAAMPQWTESNPLRIITGYTHLGAKFLQEKGFKHVQISTADGALEAAPAMGTADAILDLVSSGTTLRENNLKQLEGGRMLDSQGVLVGNRKALEERPEILNVAREMLERLEAHLRAKNQFVVTANMRGASEEEVARNIFSKTAFPGLQGPTISRVYTADKESGEVRVDYFSVVLVIPKSHVYKSICEIREAGGSGVLVTPLTYIFDEEPPRWQKLLDQLQLSPKANGAA